MGQFRYCRSETPDNKSTEKERTNCVSAIWLVKKGIWRQTENILSTKCPIVWNRMRVVLLLLWPIVSRWAQTMNDNCERFHAFCKRIWQMYTKLNDILISMCAFPSLSSDFIGVVLVFALKKRQENLQIFTIAQFSSIAFTEMSGFSLLNRMRQYQSRYRE